MARIKWTKAEKQAVLTAAYPLYVKDGFTFAQAFTKAQECLPTSRRRKLYSDAVFRLSKALKAQIVAKNKRTRTIAVKMGSIETLRGPNTAASMVTPIEGPLAGSVHIHAHSEHMPIEHALKALITAITTKIIKDLNAQIPIALQQLQQHIGDTRHE
jgi:hypothetical protein